METVKGIPILKVGVKNHNHRIYTSKNVQKIIKRFKEIKHVLFGELILNDKKTSDDINLKNASHIVDNIYIQDNILYADIRLLDNVNGTIALSMLECGTGVLRTRLLASIKDKFVNIEKLITLDVIREECDSFKGIL